jgi:hypothetical protein
MFGTFNLFLQLCRHLVFVDKPPERGAGGLLCYGVGRIKGAVDPAAFGDFTTFVALT